MRADAPLRIGARLIVVPDEALASASDLDEESEATQRPALAAPARQSPIKFGPMPAEIRAAQSTTTPFAMDDILASDDPDLMAATSRHRRMALRKHVVPREVQPARPDSTSRPLETQT